MIDAPALPPPAVVAPAPREVSFGLVAGTAPRGTRRVIVRIGGRVLADRPLRGNRFSLRVDLPQREVAVRITAVDSAGGRSSALVRHVRGLPRAAETAAAAPRLEPALARHVRLLTHGFGATSAVYVQDLRSGYGAAWNARARFPAASTLKLAIAVTALRGPRPPGLEALLHEMLVHSDNEAANRLLAALGGSWRVEATLRDLGLRDSLMYGGYEVEERRTSSARRPIPLRVEAQPRFGVGKHTSAYDLARLARDVHLAASGRGPLPRLGVAPAEARHLLWILARVGDRGKLGRYLGGAASLLHKGGWLPTARHDAGIVAWRGGVFAVAVLTWSDGGVGSSADVLAGRVARSALDTFGRIG